MPRGWRWLEPLGQRLHALLIRRFSSCWIPDYETEPNLSGVLSHTTPLPHNARFIGPLSRFEYEEEEEAQEQYDAVAILSGLEPQRTILEKQLIAEYKQKQESLLLIRGKIGGPQTAFHIANGSVLGITIQPTLSSGLMRTHLMRARTIISRSGYSSIMDYAELGLIEKAQRGEITLRLIPTPGQPEQEYLAKKWNKN